MVDDKAIGVMMELFDDDTVLTLLQIPEFNVNQFLFFWDWFNQRETETLSKKESIDKFVDLFLMFPYCEGLREWFDSKLSNADIVAYRGDGVDLNTALTLVADTEG